MMQKFIHTVLKTQSSYRQVIQKCLRLNNIDLTFEMLYILHYLSKNDRINQQELSNLTFKDKSSLSYLITNMEKRGYIVREEDTKDKRNKLIIFTSEGRQLFHEVRTLLDQEYARMEQKIDAEKMQSCICYLEEISVLVKEFK